ncbi:transposase [Methylosinus sporium]|uniref:Transposase n=1 Tax=Methylosinus sporium TaxID=428 RepID=A0A549T0Z0_METSR|nr:transposase [Methylosinus sporium]
MQVSLLEILRDIPDHRRREGKRFDLSTVLLYAIIAMVGGANSYRQMHEFIRAHRLRLNDAFGLKLPYTPSYTGLRLILQGVDRQTLARWMKQTAGMLKGLYDLQLEVMHRYPRLFCDETPMPVLASGHVKLRQFWAHATDDRPWAGPAPPAVAYPHRDNEGWSARTVARRIRRPRPIPRPASSAPSARRALRLRKGRSRA